MSDEKVQIHASGGQEVSYRKSPLMRLTKIAYPILPRETPIYIDPTMIMLVHRVMVLFKEEEGGGKVEVTEIYLYGGPKISVTESPDEIATRRDMSVGAR